MPVRLANFSEWFFFAIYIKKARILVLFPVKMRYAIGRKFDSAIRKWR